MNGRIVSIAGALLALVAFFLPWASYAQRSFSGADLAGALAGVTTGGLRGSDLGLLTVPALAILAIVFVAVSWSKRADEREARFRLWGATSALTGLVVALYFLGSATLGGSAGAQFPAVVKALGAGDFTGLGIGIYLVIAGLAAATLGALLQPATGAVSVAWRTQDYVLLAVIAVVFGAIYWVWVQPYVWITGIAAQPGAELLFAIWFTSGLLGGYIIRRPGAAFLAETLAAGAEVLLGAAAGPILIVTGLMEALGAELVFAIGGYKKYSLPWMIAAGAAAALVALPWNWFRLGYFSLDPTFLILLLGIRLVGGGLAGLVAKVVGDLVAATGSLNYFAIGRERVREV